jgi:hypothetical protein
MIKIIRSTLTFAQVRDYVDERRIQGQTDATKLTWGHVLPQGYSTRTGFKSSARSIYVSLKA